ncbi:hypothetical protein Tco_1428223 [Tanacetum coccineum]
MAPIPDISRHKDNIPKVFPFVGANGHPTSSTKQSYASVANGDVAAKGAQNNGEQDKVNCILLSDIDLITVEDTFTMVLVKVKEDYSISSMYRICRNEALMMSRYIILGAYGYVSNSIMRRHVRHYSQMNLYRKFGQPLG